MKARKKPTVPDGTTAVVEILQAEQVFGNFGPQLALKLAIRGGRYSGFEFMDWSKLNKDPKTGEVFVELGTKAADIFQAALGDEFDEDDCDPEDLVGRRFMARIGLAGKKQDRNRVEYGSIGEPPDARESA